MNSESLVATEKMLDVVKRLLDEQEPDSLFPRILNIAREVLKADAAVLDIGGDAGFHYFGYQACQGRKPSHRVEPAAGRYGGPV